MDMLQEMSRTLHTQLSTIHTRMDTFTEQVDSVERGLRPNTSTPHTSELSALESQSHLATERPLTWADRDLNERMVIDQDEILV